MMMTVL